MGNQELELARGMERHPRIEIGMDTERFEWLKRGGAVATCYASTNPYRWFFLLKKRGGKAAYETLN